MRSIPACAGEPNRVDSRTQAQWVYPRVCGGTSGLFTSLSLDWGLSPRVRGNPQSAGMRIATYRSIPACAGEPYPISPHRQCRKVYPRVCGGTISTVAATLAKRGLSPRVRGNRPGLMHRGPSRRSIPACAGEPPALTSQGKPLRVYPRVCGGTTLRVHFKHRRIGLSPRVRGNHVASPLQAPSHRSIPACAGEPRRCAWRRASTAVYPRVCGGTHRGNVRVCSRHGSIPACAGEPDTARPVDQPRRVYPRVCGGTRDMPACC